MVAVMPVLRLTDGFLMTSVSSRPGMISRRPTPAASLTSPATPVRNTASCTTIATIERGVAPSALRTPISFVRSLTAIILMFDTPTTPAASVPAPISDTNTEMIQNIIWKRWNCSTFVLHPDRLLVVRRELVALGQLATT